MRTSLHRKVAICTIHLPGLTLAVKDTRADSAEQVLTEVPKLCYTFSTA